MQHLVWILGLKPVTGGALTTSATGSSSSENSSVITTAVMADLPVLSNMVTRLFESSSHLSDSSVKYLIEALCHLSEERLVNARTMKVKIVSLRSILRRLIVEGEIRGGS